MLLAACTTLLLASGSVRAATGDAGYQDGSTSGTSTPTGTKRSESLLWWNDGAWWANMWSASARQFHIFRLETSTQTWSDTGVEVDSRANTHADVLWDGSHLYVASHLFVADGSSAVSGAPSYLFRFSYDAPTQRYSLDPGFPTTINNHKTETLVIDKDSTGKLWATWQQGNQIYVNRTVGSDLTWGVPFPLPAAGSAVTVDDTSTVVAFGSDKIGVMWSNESTSSDAMFFAVHHDGQSDTTWDASRAALAGSQTADDHINLKAAQVDGSGRVFAAVKSSFTSSAQPLIMLLVRDAASGDWSSYPIARVSDCPNRPIVVVDEENRVLHVLYTAPAPPGYSCSSSGGAIYEKTSSLDAIAFPTGTGTPVMLDADSPYVHNVSSTKQSVNGATGLVALAANGRTQFYWHAYESIVPPGPPPAPIADFSATPTSGFAPLAVAFVDRSSGSPTSWSWSFGDGATSTAQNPSHTYGAPGTYTVTLTVANATGSDSEAWLDRITVSAPPPDFTLAVSPSSRAVVRGAATTYSVTATSVGGFAGWIDLTVGGLPVGATATFDTNPLEVASTSSAVLTVATATTTKQGGYTLTVTGVSAGTTHSTTATLQIKRK